MYSQKRIKTLNESKEVSYLKDNKQEKQLICGHKMS